MRSERRTPVYDSQNWTARQREGENESPSSLLLSLHHLSPLQVGTCQLASHHTLILLYVKTVRATIWLWVMEGGLNPPFEILEPVGKPQLFKCRKSWFYKMLIWSALGTSEQHGSGQEPPPSHHPAPPSSIQNTLLKRGSKGKIGGGGRNK